MKEKPSLPIIGWREWLSLPDLGVERVKAKIDTGARTSALHAFDVEQLTIDGSEWVRFFVHPLQDERKTTIAARAPLHDMRRVKSSNGKSEWRPVIVTTVALLGKQWQIELTLTRRDEMGFRLLLGRQALKQRVLVDVSRSFVTTKRTKRSKT